MRFHISPRWVESKSHSVGHLSTGLQAPRIHASVHFYPAALAYKAACYLPRKLYSKSALSSRAATAPKIMLADPNQTLNPPHASSSGDGSIKEDYPLALSIIMPVLNGGLLLQESLRPLLPIPEGSSREVIVIDDGSTDGSADLARKMGARVISSGGHALGPAAARNLGAQHSRGRILMFVDADVVVNPDVPDSVELAFQDSSMGAIYGSYDAAPRERNYASLYMNLRHHHGHRKPSNRGTTFWTGLGAVRREAFLAIDGFDTDSFPYPSVEDVDLGRRLVASGMRIHRDPNLRGTHLKRWSWKGVVYTDIFRRAAPWANLMIAHPGQVTDLNVSRGEQLKALFAGAWLLSVLLAIFQIIPILIPITGFALALIANRSLVWIFLRAAGLPFALVGVTFHQVHLLYSGLTYAACRMRWFLPRAKLQGTP